MTATPYGGTTDTATGGHGDLTTGVTFNYGSDTSETVKKILIDLPAGGVGNPNAIPYADRCTRETFDSSTCDAKSQIGVVTISAKAYIFGLLPIDLTDMTGTISEIQTDPEVPTVVGAYIQPKLGGINAGDPIRAYAKFYPVTSGPDGDFRIRAETDPFPTTANTILGSARVQITKYEQKLFGKLANGNVFITNPTRCDTWNSWGYAQFYNNNDGANSDPFQTGTNDYFKTDVVPTEPNCDTLAPFNVGADAHADGSTRGGHAAFSTQLKIDGLGADPIGAAVPKTVTATLPKGLTIDVAQLGRVCTNEAFAAFQCPASTQVGTVHLTTPMITAGLSGEAYLVKPSAGHNLPDLGIHVKGAIEFNVRGTNQFVNINQIQTTFDNIPGVGFSTFDLSIAGGNNGLLMVQKCPTNGSTPVDGGSTHFDITSYQGQVQSFDSPTKYTTPPCFNYNVSIKSVSKCLKKGSTLSVTPTIKARSHVRYAKLWINNKYVKKSSKSPYKLKAKLSSKLKLKAGKTYKYKVKVYFKVDSSFPKGRVQTKTAKFKVCK
ncbi:MAG: hypothetical protein QM648_02970 [Solirubrobacterales bacterium]